MTLKPGNNHPTLLGSILFLILQATHAKLFESKAAKAARLALEQTRIENEQKLKFYTVFGAWQFDRTGFYTVVSVTVVIFVALGVQCGVWWRRRREEEEVKEKAKLLDVVIVGNLHPKTGAGWLHLMHFLGMTDSVKVRAVVDSQYSQRSSYRPPPAFVNLIHTLLDLNIECVKSVDELNDVLYPTGSNGQKITKSSKILCVVAGNTQDNPRYFRECINFGATHIYLEPPGAPSASQLKDMASQAELRGVRVYMGYQKLSSSYIQEAVKFSHTIPKSHVFFCHNEGYTTKSLSGVIARNPEGMMFSVACQELAVLVTQYNIRVGDVYKFKVNTNPLFSEKASFVNDSNGKKFTDLIRVAFKITTRKGKTVSVMADRCGGLVSFAVVKSHRGEELKRFQSLKEEKVVEYEGKVKKEKTLVPHFTVEEEDYLLLKNRVVEDIRSNCRSIQKSEMGLLSIKDGIDVMMLAEHCSLEIDKVLSLEE